MSDMNGREGSKKWRLWEQERKFDFWHKEVKNGAFRKAAAPLFLVEGTVCGTFWLHFVRREWLNFVEAFCGKKVTE